MIKKLIILFLCILITFSLSGCGKNNSIPKKHITEHTEFTTEKFSNTILENTINEIAESEDIEYEIVETEITEPEVTEIEITEIEITESEYIDTEPSTSEIIEPETVEPETTELETSELEAFESEGSESETSESETSEPEIILPEDSNSEIAPKEEVESEEEQSEILQPEISEPEDTSHYIPIPEEWNLIVVNKWNKIPEGYSIELSELSNGKKVDSRILIPLQEMFDAANNEAIPLIVREGYRTTEEQQKLLDDKIQSYIDRGYSKLQAEKNAKNWVALPGTSEHELGLAVDINIDSTENIHQTAYLWLQEHAHTYGFILRYPEEKESITGIKYEPWHYRYVGVETAKEIYESRLCLEEYLQSKNNPQ